MLFWPFELVVFKAFIPKAEARFVPIQEFQFVTALTEKQKQRAHIKRLFHFEFVYGGKAVDLSTKIDGVTMQINLWGINKHYHANFPNNFASQNTSVELGMDKVALPILRVIAVVDDLDISLTAILLKAEDLTFLGLSKLLRRI